MAAKNTNPRRTQAATNRGPNPVLSATQRKAAQAAARNAKAAEAKADQDRADAEVTSEDRTIHADGKPVVDAAEQQHADDPLGDDVEGGAHVAAPEQREETPIIDAAEAASAAGGNPKQGVAAPVGQAAKLAAARAAAEAAAVAGALPVRETPVEAAKRQATSGLFEWPTTGLAALVEFVVECAGSTPDAPTKGQPYISTEGKLYTHTSWFMEYLAGKGLTPPKAIVTKVLRDQGMSPRSVPIPGLGRTLGLYVGPAPKGTAKVPRRDPLRGAPAVAAAPPSPEVEALGEDLVNAIDAAMDDHYAMTVPAGQAIERHDKATHAWLADRVARHIRTLV